MRLLFPSRILRSKQALYAMLQSTISASEMTYIVGWGVKLQSLTTYGHVLRSTIVDQSRPMWLGIIFAGRWICNQQVPDSNLAHCIGQAAYEHVPLSPSSKFGNGFKPVSKQAHHTTHQPSVHSPATSAGVEPKNRCHCMNHGALKGLTYFRLSATMSQGQLKTVAMDSMTLLFNDTVSTKKAKKSIYQCER